MKALSKNILELIGNTPLMKIEIEKITIYAKLEMFNPGGSIKDRIALTIINDLEKKGLITQEKKVIEATSGNTGIGLSLVCAAKNYGCTIVMPENMSEERKKIIKAFGAELILTPAENGVPGAVKEVEKRITENPNIYIPANQFKNPTNVKTHYEETAVEIMEQLTKLPGSFVAGVGTGGTLTGVGKRLKEENKNTIIIAVEPSNSPVLSGGKPGIHKIQGIGAGFIPEILDKTLIEEVITVNYEETRYFCQKLSQKYGILAGISSGANIAGIVKAFQKGLLKEPITTVLPDTGERYLSTDLF